MGDLAHRGGRVDKVGGIGADSVGGIGRIGRVDRIGGLVAEMSDGVRLVADAWHPRDGGPWPVLLQRLPYGRSSASTPVLPHPSWFAAQGYAVVVQDVRGCGDSEGVFEPFVHEGADGAATIEWASRLPFANGDVATYGFSYQGLAQLYAAALRPPALRAIAPMMCCPDPYEGWTYERGCLRWGFVAEWAAQLVSLSRREPPRPADLGARPLEAALGPDAPPWYLDWLGHPHDDGYWAARRPEIGRIEVPAFTVLGWFDDFSGGTARLIELLGAEAVCGPWAHMPWGTRLGDVEFGAGASGRVAAEALVAFFDRVLKLGGGPPERRVSYFAHGAGWRSSPSWPPPAEVRRLHAASDGAAASRHGGGRLVAGPTGQALADVLVADPADPHPDLPPLVSVAAAEDRHDVLCYTGEPLVEPILLAGAPAVLLETAADRVRHQLAVALVAVDGSGEPYVIARGAAAATAGPDGTASTRIELGPTAWSCAAGTRLRLEVSGDRYPTFAPGALLPGAAGGQVTIEVVRCSIELPVVPSDGTVSDG